MCLFVRYVEINFRSTFVAAESIQALKTIREDLTVRCLDIGETASMMHVCLQLQITYVGIPENLNDTRIQLVY